MPKKTAHVAERELFSTIFCDGGVDYFGDVVTVVLKIFKKYKIKDLEAKEKLWKSAAQVHFMEDIICGQKPGKKGKRS